MSPECDEGFRVVRGWELAGRCWWVLQRTPALERSRALMSVPSESGGQMPITGKL